MATHEHSIVILELGRANLDYISKIEFCNQKGECFDAKRYEEAMEKPNNAGKILMNVALFPLSLFIYYHLVPANKDIDLAVRQAFKSSQTLEKTPLFSRKIKVLLVPNGIYSMKKIDIIDEGSVKFAKKDTTLILEGATYYIGKISVKTFKKNFFSKLKYEIKVEDEKDQSLEYVKQKFPFIDALKVETNLLQAKK